MNPERMPMRSGFYGIASKFLCGCMKIRMEVAALF